MIVRGGESNPHLVAIVFDYVWFIVVKDHGAYVIDRFVNSAFTKSFPLAQERSAQVCAEDMGQVDWVCSHAIKI
jgi:hypothetical protein